MHIIISIGAVAATLGTFANTYGISFTYVERTLLLRELAHTQVCCCSREACGFWKWEACVLSTVLCLCFTEAIRIVVSLLGRMLIHIWPVHRDREGLVWTFSVASAPYQLVSLANARELKEVPLSPCLIPGHGLRTLLLETAC